MSANVLVVLGTFVYCIGSGVIPVMHAEAYLVSASLLAAPSLGWPLVIAATLGQMVAKVAMYGAGRGAVLLPYPWLQRRLAAAKAKMEDRRNVGSALIFVSASTGFPPFYVVSVAAGMLRAPLPAFIVFGAAGRFLRFAVAVFLPHLLKG